MGLTDYQHCDNMQTTERLKSFLNEAVQTYGAANKEKLALDGGRPRFRVSQGSLTELKPKVRSFVEEAATLCCPANIHICDGTERENQYLLNIMQQLGTYRTICLSMKTA